jgi:molybdopterin converting factor subunit 1
MKIWVFAGLAEALGESSITIDLTLPVKVADVRSALGEQYPEAKSALQLCFAAVNQKFANEETVIYDGDEIALIPPVSGG